MMHKIIWVKTPKCAGTSIKKAICDSDLKNKIIIVLPDHLDDFILKHPNLWENCYKFAIVRNPFDKFISAWKYLPLTNKHDLKWTIDNLPTKDKYYRAYHHITRTQSDTIGYYKYDNIIKYEDINRGMSGIFEMFGMRNVSLPIINQSDRKPDYREYYDDETRKKVAELYAEDLQRFKYKF